MTKLFASSLCVLAVVLACRGAQAQASTHAELDTATLRARVAQIQAILDERAGRAQLWQYGWAGLGYAVTGAFVAISATTKDKVQRLDFAFAAGGAFVDTTVHVLGSIQIYAAAGLREQPEASREELRLKLAFAEAKLRAVAEAEQDRQSLLKAQILPIGFSVATGLVLGLGFGHWRGAIVNTALSIVVNELRVLSQPTSTIAAWEQYRRDAGAARRSWSIALSPTGCMIYGSF
ncbi:MAG TPA: hypothetical protein VFN67_03985 [Polyangiales bacterium]|nr:hypothetical protein [Polyangiales bacterium]